MEMRLATTSWHLSDRRTVSGGAGAGMPGRLFWEGEPLGGPWTWVPRACQRGAYGERDVICDGCLSQNWQFSALTWQRMSDRVQGSGVGERHARPMWYGRSPCILRWAPISDGNLDPEAGAEPCYPGTMERSGSSRR